MKLIAHRGASLIKQENTLDSLLTASELGAYAAECDIRRTRDGRYVIFHDPDLQRMANVNAELTELDYTEVKNALSDAGKRFYSLEEIAELYTGGAKLLFHINVPLTDELASILKRTKFDYIAGVTDIADIKAAAQILDRDRILAFMPKKHDWRAFMDAGAGIIRLWENWLDEIRPDSLPSEVWIMCNRTGSGMNGTVESLDRIDMLHADGALLNDIELGIKWKMNRV